MPPNVTFKQLTPHIHKLDLPFFGGRLPVGVWLVHGPEGWVVVDAGAPSFEQLILEQILKQTGGERPHLLILTHGHQDHAAAAQQMRDEWKLPIAAGRDEIPYLIGSERYRRIPARSPIYGLAQLSPPALFGRNVQRPLDEGMRLDGMEVFHAPGHAPGMVALLHREDRALICGDAFANLGGKLGDPLAPFTYDMPLNHQSQARLIELDFDHLLVSHGPPLMNDGRAKARALVEGRRQRMAKRISG